MKIVRLPSARPTSRYMVDAARRTGASAPAGSARLSSRGKGSARGGAGTGAPLAFARAYATICRKAPFRRMAKSEQPPKASGRIGEAISFIPPCLPTLVSKPPEGPDWQHEVKWDGYRIMCSRHAGELRIITRNGWDWTNRFPTIAAGILDLAPSNVVIDGEACVLDESGLSRFGLLQGDFTGSERASGRAVLVAFDLLFIDGEDLRGRALEERRGRLAELVAGMPAIIFSETIEGSSGQTVYEHACRLGLEGIVSKKRDAPYRSGRRREWLKTKCTHTDEFVVIGYEPGKGFAGLGKVRVAYPGPDGNLRYAGGVGTGFNRRTAKDLRRRMDGIQISRPPIAGLKRKGVWVKPEIIVELEYRGWTEADGRLRHPSFKGVREDRSLADVAPPASLPPSG